MNVSYVLETTFIEPIDSGQLAVKRFNVTGSGLSLPAAEDPTFVVVNLCGSPADRGAMLRGASTRSGFIIPSEDAVEYYREVEAGYNFKTVIAGSADELVERVVSSLEQMKSSLRSFDGSQMVCGPYGDPCPDPVAADIVIQACRIWSGNDIDEVLASLLGDEQD